MKNYIKRSSEMKRGFLTVLMLGTAVLCAFAQTVTLDEAIRTCGEEISGRFEKNTKIAVLNFGSSSEAMSAYVIDELNTVLVNDGRLTVLSRKDLDLIREEIDFNDSGEVSNQSAQQIGRMLGAQFIVNGSLGIVGGNYRFVGQVLEIETAAIKYSKTLNIENNTVVKSLMSDKTSGSAVLVEDFTSAERAGAVAMNLAFGLGSFRQKDRLGGTVTLIAEGLGLVVAIIGIVNTGSTETSDTSGSYSSTESDYTGVVILGGGVYAAGFIFGAVRAITFHRPGSVLAMNVPFGLDLVSDHQGNTGLRASYTLHY
jgi:TolB-like protein